MSDKIYTVEVQPDFIERQVKAKPTQAVAELIWNGLDADATQIDVRIDRGELSMTSIVVRDNGHGIAYQDAPDLFTHLGGSWKKPGACTKTKGRMLHGYEGRGRFKAFSLGRVAEWHVTYRADDGSLRAFDITILEDNISEVRIGDEAAVSNGQPGVEVAVSELHHEFRSLELENAPQELTEIFALYLEDYRDVQITYESIKIDPATAIASRDSLKLTDITDQGVAYPVDLEIIEWRTVTKRALYLCNEQGFPLSQISTRFHLGDFQFSAYLKSSFITRLHSDAELDLAEMNPLLLEASEEAQQAVRSYFRDRAAERARSVVEEWKAEKIYPYKGEAVSPIERAERKVFDIVAVTASDYMPDFQTAPTKNKALHLRLLRSGIERSPEELQIILNEVLGLPKRKQEELAKLLREASLSSIISAAKIVADRLKFLSALELILFDTDMKERLKERSQLHRILADNTWVFGEEFNLSVDDKSLTEVLRKHRKLLGDETVIDRPVKHISKKRGIVDLMLSRAIRRHRASDIEHLVIELKRPNVKIGKAEVTQIEEYAISVAKDERFRKVSGIRWIFWVLSNDIDDYAEYRMDERGIISAKENIQIGVKTWSQVIEENKARLQFFQEKLEHQVDQGTALRHLQEKYDKFLRGVVDEESAPEESDHLATA